MVCKLSVPQKGVRKFKTKVLVLRKACYCEDSREMLLREDLTLSSIKMYFNRFH